jgi:predicted permease
MFGLLERLMLSPPPGIRDAGRVVRVQLGYTPAGGQPYTMSTTSYPVFEAVASLGSAFGGVAGVRSDTVTTGRGAELAEVAVVQATGEYFAVLGVKPALGRLFGPGDDQLPNGNDVVVLSHGYWMKRYAGDPAVIGTGVVVDGLVLTVIGVAPPGFNGTELGATDLFMPISTAFRARGAGWWANPGMRMVSIVARLRAGVRPQVASDMVALALRGGGGDGSRWDQLTSVPLESLVPGRSSRQSAQARIAVWLSGVSLVVLLVATANVGTLLLLRSARRRRDVAVRISLGAGRGRLARQALTESVLLALLGAAVGVLLSRWFGDLVRVTLLPGLAPAESPISRQVLITSMGAALVAGVAAGLSPLLQLRRRNLSVDLNAGVGHGTSGRFVLQHLLVGIQVAFCTVLLIGAGLFVRSLQRVQSQDLGFSTARLLHVQLDYRGVLRGVEHDLAHEEAVRRIRTVPGVTSATVVQGMPFSSHHIPPINIPGYDLPPPNVRQLPIMYGATPEYLAMMGVIAREGRLLTDGDGRGTPPVVLVNETMARTVWPGESAIGKCVRAGHTFPPGEDPMAAAASLPCREVVGVVRDSRARSLRTDGDEAALMQYYVPFAQLPPTPAPDPSAVHAIPSRPAAPRSASRPPCSGSCRRRAGCRCSPRSARTRR